MTKLVNKLFDGMFQGKNEISYTEKILVVGLSLIVLATTLFAIIDFPY
jgi:hypothetical protein